ncbi:chitotriosidase-1-like [Paramacrobiotus metropolitanus]|uniref:chitotriosidase-1-like n=1 Tax=Paramacrobiotus metropolitanus TaxID=2943436 RepID=UPI0024456C2F|nr:chitotriosidase-1-like [Paramacrobiotus metropolitanus]
MEKDKILSAYYSYSASDPLQPEDIDGSLLTHLIVGWSTIDSTGHLTFSSDYDDGFRRCVLLRQKFPHLKVMLTCGGGGPEFSNAAHNPVLRAMFIRSALDVLDRFGFDGLDIDWEFPVWRSRSYDRQSFIEWLRDIRVAFDAHKSPLLLTIAAASPKLIIDPAYDIPAISSCVDFVNLMCYDFNLFTYYNIWASHNAPLYKRPEQAGFFSTMNTAWAAEYWVEKGLAREKLAVGVPTYARSWKLLFPCWHSYNAVCTGPGVDNGFLTYPKAVDILTNGGTRIFDQNACVPYMYRGRQWISYEDEESIQLKAQWIRKHQFGGAMVFSLNQDDFKGVFSSSGEPFPLTRILSSIVKK